MACKMRQEIKRTEIRAWSRTLYLQLLQHLEFTLYLRGSVGIVAKPVNENLRVDECRHWSGSFTPCNSNSYRIGPPALPASTPGYAGDTAVVPHIHAAGSVAAPACS